MFNRGELQLYHEFIIEILEHLTDKFDLCYLLWWCGEACGGKWRFSRYTYASFSINSGQGLCFYPFRKRINGNNYKFQLAHSFGKMLKYIEPLSVEMLSCNNGQDDVIDLQIFGICHISGKYPCNMPAR